MSNAYSARGGRRSLAALAGLVSLAGLASTAHAQSFGNALSFDLDDQITCAGNFDATALTIEAWIYVRDYGPDGYGGIAAWGRQQDASYELGVFGLNGEPQLLFTLNLGKPGYTAVLQSDVFSLNTWTHIAVVYDGTFMKFYKNGLFVNSQQVNAPIQPGGDGAVFALSNLFTGNDQHADISMDEVRIWNVALSEQDIHCRMSRPLVTPQAGLLAYYPFDESEGQFTADASGNGRDGVLGLTAAPEINDPTRVVSGAVAQCFDIVTQPSSLTQCRGGVAVLEFNVCGQDPVTYQWRRNGVNIEGATLGVYTITGLSDTTAGIYDCVVVSPCGTVTSVPATVAVCPADFDCSGFVDTDDYDAFVRAFELGGDDADFDASGFVDTDDFTSFVLAFQLGC